MKKYAMLTLVAVLMLMSACSSAATSTPVSTTDSSAPSQREIIAVVLPSLDNPLMLGFQDAFKNAFGAQYDVQVASADGNAVTT